VADIVKLNAAAGLVAFELAKDSSKVSVDLDSRFTDAYQRVTVALESGAAAEKLSRWMAATQA
jgi:anthranilate phosphoribosyltransferase